jgi:hypothetical protein
MQPGKTLYFQCQSSAKIEHDFYTMPVKATVALRFRAFFKKFPKMPDSLPLYIFFIFFIIFTLAAN